MGQGPLPPALCLNFWLKGASGGPWGQGDRLEGHREGPRAGSAIGVLRMRGAREGPGCAPGTSTGGVHGFDHGF